MNIRHILSVALLLLTATVAFSKDEFTALEQQQISIATPGLFAQSNAFTVDFAALRSSDYSFPLPVGKAKAVSDYKVEITTKKGDAVKAMFAGTVRLARRNPTYGNVVVVRHNNGLETVYAYNAQNLVKVGDKVKAGQTIAIVGGEDDRTFCLFYIMVNGRRINPETILSLNSHRLLRQTIMCKNNGGSISLTVEKADKHESDKAVANSFDSKGRMKLNLADMSPTEWCYPLPGAKVISPYGRRGGRRHTGVDIKTKANDEIHAAFDGTVTMAQRYFAYGNYIKIKHDNGLETIYSHNSKNLVKVGDKVKAGQVIALTGQTGRATTPHLHFECHVNGQNFDPSYVFDHQNHSIKMSLLTFTKQGGSVKINADRNYMANKR